MILQSKGDDSIQCIHSLLVAKYLKMSLLLPQTHPPSGDIFINNAYYSVSLLFLSAKHVHYQPKISSFFFALKATGVYLGLVQIWWTYGYFNIVLTKQDKPMQTFSRELHVEYRNKKTYQY